MDKQIINCSTDVVTDAIQGILLCNNNIKCVAGTNVLVRRDYELIRNKQVMLISGGGSGHEPAHAGYIGEGMLSAAVLGNVFASPPVSAILAAIRTCAGPFGVLLIVKNYTGDRLNFGMACERARSMGIKVKMVIVADDCALKDDNKGICGGRGIAGTILVHKIAGAAAAAGLSLEEVFDEAQRTALSVSSIGVAFTTCTIPGSQPSNRLDGSVFELGMGIHGEPGKEIIGIKQSQSGNLADITSKYLVHTVLGIKDDSSTSTLYKSTDSLVLLINNLGGMSAIELQIVTGSILGLFKKQGLNVSRVLSGLFMTALDMKGLSLSVLKSDSLCTARIDAPTTAPAWSRASFAALTEATDIAYDTVLGDALVAGGAPCPVAVAVIQAIAEKLVAIEPDLTSFDLICGDGDCGLVMKKGAEAVLLALKSSNQAGSDSASLCSLLADSVSSAMGGTSGALLELMLRAMAVHLKDVNAAGITTEGQRKVVGWISALSVGTEAIKSYGGAQVGMRTLLDALVPAVDALVSGFGVSAAAQAAQDGADRTRTMSSRAGRSSYIGSDRMTGTPDPGAVAVAAAFDVAVKRLAGLSDLC